MFFKSIGVIVWDSGLAAYTHMNTIYSYVHVLAAVADEFRVSVALAFFVQIPFTIFHNSPEMALCPGDHLVEQTTVIQKAKYTSYL